MFSHSNQTVGHTSEVYNASPDWNRERATIYSGDIRHPWKSVYGFPMTAARLATGEELVLHCREDEVFDYLAHLNTLLESPDSLKRVYALLDKLAQVTRQKIETLVRHREQPLNEGDLPDVLAEVEDILAGSGEQTVADRLADLLSPDVPGKEIVGLGKMLARLQRLMAGLDTVKERGFKVVVIDRRRQPVRPGLEARRDETPPIEGQFGELPAGFLCPPRYHHTLWAYLVRKSEGGQSVIWN